jgi:hypothetical protein
MRGRWDRDRFATLFRFTPSRSALLRKPLRYGDGPNQRLGGEYPAQVHRRGSHIRSRTIRDWQAVEIGLGTSNRSNPRTRKATGHRAWKRSRCVAGSE